MKVTYQFKNESSASEFAAEIKKNGAQNVSVEGASVSKEIKELDSKAACEDLAKMEEMFYSGMREVYREMEERMRYFNRSLDEVWNTMRKHMENGHLPAIKDAGKMEQILKILKLDDSFNVSKPTLYMAASENSVADISIR